MTDVACPRCGQPITQAEFTPDCAVMLPNYLQPGLGLPGRHSDDSFALHRPDPALDRLVVRPCAHTFEGVQARAINDQVAGLPANVEDRVRAQIVAEIEALADQRASIQHRPGSIHAERQLGERVGLGFARRIAAGTFDIHSREATG